MSAALADLEKRFDEAMMNVYRRALKECNYNATRFLQMLGLTTAEHPEGTVHKTKAEAEAAEPH